MKLGSYINGWVNGVLLLIVALIVPDALKSSTMVATCVICGIWMVVYQFVKKPIMYESLSLFILYILEFLAITFAKGLMTSNPMMLPLIFGILFIAVFTGLFFYIKSNGGNIVETDDDEEDDDDEYYDDDDEDEE